MDYLTRMLALSQPVQFKIQPTGKGKQKPPVTYSLSRDALTSTQVLFYIPFKQEQVFIHQLPSSQIEQILRSLRHDLVNTDLSEEDRLSKVSQSLQSAVNETDQTLFEMAKAMLSANRELPERLTLINPETLENCSSVTLDSASADAIVSHDDPSGVAGESSADFRPEGWGKGKDFDPKAFLDDCNGVGGGARAPASSSGLFARKAAASASSAAASAPSLDL